MIVSWQDDMRRLDYGIEQELFIFHPDGAPPTREEIIAVLALRVALLLGVSRGYWCERPGLRPLFWNACLTGTAPQSILDEDYSILTRLRPELPDDLREPLARVLLRFTGWQQMAA